MHIFAGNDPLDWPGIGIIREFVGDLKNAPLKSGETYRDMDHHWRLRALQDLVDDNRKRGLVTILCPFSWDGSKETQFTGSSPCQSPWYKDYKSRMREWAAQFKGQSDVWIELMNEPFHPLNTAEDDALWLAAMTDMVDNLRSADWSGIILVPGSAWGQDETVIERMGPRLLAGRNDLIFDVHIYNRWQDQPDTIPARCAKIKASGLPFIFGEFGTGSGDGVRDTHPFMKAAQENHFSVLAWGWGTWGPRKPNNLQLNDGTPNDVGNFGWGSAYKAFLNSGCTTEVRQ